MSSCHLVITRGVIRYTARAVFFIQPVTFVGANINCCDRIAGRLHNDAGGETTGHNNETHTDNLLYTVSIQLTTTAMVHVPGERQNKSHKKGDDRME